MTSDELNNLLKKYDFGDDWLEDKNRLFDTEYTSIPRADFELARNYANEQMAWYFVDVKKFYLRGDCNAFHFVWLGHFRQWFMQNREYKNPASGRGYGFWEDENHNWAWAAVDNDLTFINWGQEVKPSEVKYDGKGSVAV